MAAVTIQDDFETQENKVCHCFDIFPHLFAMKWWDHMVIAAMRLKDAYSLEEKLWAT